MDFQEVDRRYAELKQQYEEGTLSVDEFDAALKEMMVQDEQGRWWAKSRKSGDWNYHDGSGWVQATPPSGERVSRSAKSHPQVSRPPSRPVASAQARAMEPTSEGMALVFYALSFLVPLAGIILYFVYKDRPFEADQKMARLMLILGVVSIGLSCLCSGSFFFLSLLGNGGGYYY